MFAKCGKTQEQPGWLTFARPMGSLLKHQAVERLRASAGSVRTEKDLPAYVDSYLRAISKFKAGMLLINYIGMEISKRANLPMSELIRSMATTTTFDPDTASVEETAMYAKVQKLLSEANFLSGEAVKIKVEKLVDASVMKPTRPGDVCYWREDDKCSWSTGKDVAIVIKIGTEGHSDSAMCATPNSPSQHQRGLPRYIRFANLTLADNRGEDSELIDAEDGQERQVPQTVSPRGSRCQRERPRGWWPSRGRPPAAESRRSASAPCASTACRPAAP